MTQILLVGCGNMGFAMLQGWVSHFTDWRYIVVEPNQELRQRAISLPNVDCYASMDELPQDVDPELIILAVKPQMMPDVIPLYSTFQKATFLSVAAGTTIQTIATYLPPAAQIVRTMPNTPAMIGEGMMASYANANVSDGRKALVNSLLECSGKSIWLDDEADMDAITAISGSGPAYLFHFIEVMEKAALNVGLNPDLSRELALQTVYGAASLARQSHNAPSELRKQVTSPNGTTQAALEVLMNDNALTLLVEEAVNAARNRSIELGK